MICHDWFIQLPFHLLINRLNFFVLWPWTSTFDLDLRNWPTDTCIWSRWTTTPSIVL